VAQGVGPEFKPKYCKKKKKKKKRKYPTQKKAGRVAQVVEHWVLSSNPSTTHTHKNQHGSQGSNTSEKQFTNASVLLYFSSSPNVQQPPKDESLSQMH
jgi:hypothetical protein